MNDFDFLIGSWDIANRRLTKPLTGSDDWERFPATSQCVRLFDGAATAATASPTGCTLVNVAGGGRLSTGLGRATLKR